MQPGNQSEGVAQATPLPERALTPVVRLGGAISTALILGTLAITVYSVALRYFANSPPIWADQVSGFALVALVMLGTSEAYRCGGHISIDLLTEGVLRGAKKPLAVWSELCVLAFALVLGISTWESITFNRSFGAFTAGSIEIEAWIPQLPMLAGAVMLGGLALARLLGNLRKGSSE